MAHEQFSQEFKELWEKDSKVEMLWDALETLYQGLLIECAKLDAKQRAARGINAIEKDMQTGARPMEQLGVELIALLWDRIVLRTHLKVRDAMRLLFYSCNTANAYGCALSARCIVEHVALLQYFVDRIPWKNNRRVMQKEIVAFTKKLMTLSQGSKVDWDRLVAGGMREMLFSGKWKRKMETGLPPVAELLEALDTALLHAGRLNCKGEIKFLYGILCDVVHPNWGGDFIYTPLMHRSLGCAPALDDHFKLCAVFFCPSAAAMLKHLIETARAAEGDKAFGMWRENPTA